MHGTRLELLTCGKPLPMIHNLQATPWLHFFKAQALNEWQCCKVAYHRYDKNHCMLAWVVRAVCLTQSGWRRINNAGSNAYKYKTLSESTDADLIRIVETNVLGTMLGCKEVS